MSHSVEDMDISLFLDSEMLNTLRSLDNFKGRFLDELIDIYVSTTAPVLVDLLKAIESGKDGESIRLAHKLKGMCGNLGVKRLVAILEEIELSFADIADDDRKRLSPLLKREHERSIALLHEHWHSKKKIQG